MQSLIEKISSIVGSAADASVDPFIVIGAEKNEQTGAMHLVFKTAGGKNAIKGLLKLVQDIVDGVVAEVERSADNEQIIVDFDQVHRGGPVQFATSATPVLVHNNGRDGKAPVKIPALTPQSLNRELEKSFASGLLLLPDKN